MESKIKCKVVMLATNQATGLYKHTRDYKGSLLENKLQFTTNKTYLENIDLINRRKAATNAQDTYEFYHLYLVSDEEIKVGDTVYNSVFGIGTIINKHDEDCFYNKSESGGSITTPWKRNLGNNCKKIVATTDNLCIDRDYKFVDNTPNKGFTGFNVYLPLIPQSFIEKYIEVNGKIEEVMVETEKYCINDIPDKDHICVNFDYKVKTRKDNTVIISKVKDNWSYDEHCVDMQYYMEYCKSNDYVTPQKWLAELKHY